MSLLLEKAGTAFALGIPNLARVASYRLGVKLGINPVRRLRGKPPGGPFFRPSPAPKNVAQATVSWQETALYFGRFPVSVERRAPEWHLNCLTGARLPEAGREWWRIPDFDPAVGDIKAIWEASRFDWVLAFAQRACLGETGELERLNSWLADWCKQNAPYCGPNWKCGQESSIRVMHVAMAAVILNQAKSPEAALLNLIELHLERIAPTIGYAVAQDNNHGTSEAAALFMGGSWLRAFGRSRGKRWEGVGRTWLENRAARLIGPQGSFSQYSLNYHRVMLDTFSMVEVWRRQFDLPMFSSSWYQRAVSASRWLHSLISASTGDGPNLGANDGARLLPLVDTDYRDFRPSVQLSMALFAGVRAYGDGPWNSPLSWLSVEIPDAAYPAASSQVFDDGGVAVLRQRETFAVLRYPRFRFRPSHADALHLDLWKDGENLLRDGGSYSYGDAGRWSTYFPGTESHNTIQFDDRDQMPRLGRFLFGSWLKTSFLENLKENGADATFAAGYRDGMGAEHKRRVCLTRTCLRVDDQVQGFSSKAVLRWRLRPGAWRIEGNIVTDGRDTLTVRANVQIQRFALVEGWESRYYFEMNTVPVVEIEIHEPGLLTTEYRWFE